MNYHKISFVSILIAASCLTLIGLGDPAFLDYDEAIYAKVLHDSMENGDLLSLVKDGKPWFDKPPFYFLLMATSASVFGETEFALRLPGALFTIAAIMLVWLIAYEISRNNLIASSAAVILLTTTIFIFGGRQVRFDVPATASILFAFYSFLKAKRGSPWWYVGMGIGAALSVLFRSVIGLLIFPYLLIYAFFTREWQWLKNRFFWFGMLAMTGILAPWFIYQTITIGARFWTDHFLGHIVGRYVNPVIGGPQIPFYYTSKLFSLAEPWALMFIAAIASLFVGKKQFRYIEFFAITLFTLILFGLSTTKLFYYISPALPFAALFIALALSPFLQRFWITLPLFGFAFLLTIIQIFFPFNEDTVLFPLGAKEQHIAEEEKAIGTIVASQHLPIYIYDELPRRDAFNYYSGGIPLIPAHAKTQFQLPHLLIVPANVSIKNAEAHTLFQGEFLTLFHVDAPREN